MIIKDIKKSYKSNVILENINMEIEEGEFFVILGRSGSGKSTLLKIIAGIETADSGSIFLKEEDIINIPIQKRKIGYIFQEPLLFPHMTVEENVSYSLNVAKMPKEVIREQCSKFLKLLQIEKLAKHMPNQLSGGEKQRVSIARALINSPDILLMDEPFSSLDYNLRVQMGEVIKNLKKELDLTIVFVTHDIQESMLLGDKIAFLHKGKLIETGTPQSMYYRPLNEETANFMGEYNKVKGNFLEGEFKTKYGSVYFDNIELYKDSLFIRPNKIQLVKSNMGKYIIDTIKPYGKEYRVTLKDEELIVDTYFIEDYKVGEKVEVILKP